MAKLLSAEQIITLLVQPVGQLKPGDIGDLAAALARIPGGSSHSDHDDHRALEKPLSEILTGGFGAAH
jgi:hypothetical protein